MPFLLRWSAAFVLLAATWNPTGTSYVGRAMATYPAQFPLMVLLGLVLVVGYIIYLRATLRSIGPLGMALVAAVFGALVWVLIDWGWLDTGNSVVNQWLGIVAVSLVLGIGLSWSIFRRRLTGQADVDDVDQ